MLSIYQDFNLLIRPEGKGGEYLAKVLGSGGGDTEERFSRSDIHGSFSDQENAPMLFVPETASAVRTVELVVSGNQLCVATVQPPTLAAAKDFGRRLFQAVFRDSIYVAWRRSLDKARREGVWLRLRLNLTAVPELAVLPWEYLFEGKNNHFYAQSVDTPVIRYLEHDEPSAPLAVDGPLRILVMVAHVPHLPQLNVEEEWRQLKEAVKELEAKQLLEIERLDRASALALHQRLMQRQEERPFHIFHFIGHGAYNPETCEGQLLVTDESGQEIRPLSAERLSALLRNHNRTLRLAVLNACEGARTSEIDAYVGTAQSLIRQGVIPAVVAMQYRITDRAAISFSHSFYDALATGHPVEAALSHARTMIFADDNDVEWATPVLYLRASSGQLFQTKASFTLPSSPGISPQMDEHYQAVVKAFLEGKLVPFFGLDVNLYGRRLDPSWQPGRHLPSGSELAIHLARVFGYPAGYIPDLVSVSQFAVVMTEDGRGRLYDELSLIFNGRYEVTPLHRFFVQLPRLLREKGYPLTDDSLRHRFVIATTTYDNLLERAFQDDNQSFHVVSYVTNGEQSGRFFHSKYVGSQLSSQATPIDNPSNFPALSDPDPVILKLPGAVEPFEQRFAITEDHYSDYLTYKDLSGLLPPQLKAKLKGSHHLFLGSSLRNWYLRALLYRIWESRRAGRGSWAVHPNPQEIDEGFWKASGVKLIQAEFDTYIAGLSDKLQSVPRAGATS